MLSKVLLTEITEAQRVMVMVLAKYAGWLSEEYQGRALEVLRLARYRRSCVTSPARLSSSEYGMKRRRDT